MAVFFIEDADGRFESEDGVRKFKKLSGTKAWQFLQTPEGRRKRFMRAGTLGKSQNAVYVEVPAAMVRDCRKEERRQQYVSDGYNLNPFDIHTLDNFEEERLADTAAEPETIIETAEMQCKVRLAVDSLPGKDRLLLHEMYLQETPISAREYARINGLSHTMVNKRLKKILTDLGNKLCQ